MKYLLLIAITGFITWPYYHRMRTFKWDKGSSFAAALVISAFIGLGIVKLIVFASNGGVLSDYPGLPDAITRWTFGIVCVIIFGFLTWLMLSSEWLNQSTGPMDDGAGLLAIIMLLLSAAQAFFITDVLIKTVMAFS